MIALFEAAALGRGALVRGVELFAEARLLLDECIDIDFMAGVREKLSLGELVRRVVVGTAAARGIEERALPPHLGFGPRDLSFSHFGHVGGARLGGRLLASDLGLGHALVRACKITVEVLTLRGRLRGERRCDLRREAGEHGWISVQAHRWGGCTAGERECYYRRNKE
jgi:hypothetical protein